MEIKIKVEPNEVFFYLDKLIRKIKIKNLNEYSIKFELLTVLNDQDLSPLQANETQGIIEPNKLFTVSLEYKDSKDKNCDSIIILVIYKVIEDQLIDPDPIHEPIHVPFHFRKVNLVGLDSKGLKNIFKTKLNDESSDNESIKLSPDKSPFKNRFGNLFRSNKAKEKILKNFGSNLDENLSPSEEQIEVKLKNPIDKDNKKEQIEDKKMQKDNIKEQKDDKKIQKDDNIDKKDDSKEENFPLNVAKKELKKISNEINQKIKKDPNEKIKKELNDELNNRDNLSAYSNLRYEEDTVRKLAKVIFLFTFFNFCYTIFLAFFNPINQIWTEMIENYNLDSISNKCSSWFELNKLFKNITCFKQEGKT